MYKVAVPAVRPAGAPEYADVSFRYGWVRSSFPTVDDAKAAIRRFHATRVDWFYPGPHSANPGTDYVTREAQAFIDWAHANGMKIGGAMNTNTTNPDWRLRDGPAGRYIGDPTNADYVDAAVAWGMAQIDAGMDTLVCDDFFYYDSRRKQLFNDTVISVIQAHRPGFTIAGNSGGFIGTDYVRPYAFDFHYSDSSSVWKPGEWWAASLAHRNEESALLVHPNLNMSAETRRAQIALAYAAGAHLMTPWDEYIHGGERLFADPAAFADLYGFVRALGQLGYLNGYEDAAVGGYDLRETRYGSAAPITVDGGGGSLSVFGRAQPGRPAEPIVLHLVESGVPGEATLRLHRPALFDTGDVVCTLYTLRAYDEEAHEAAASSGDYGPLIEASVLPTVADGDELVIEVPGVNPWGAIVIRPVGGRD